MNNSGICDLSAFQQQVLEFREITKLGQPLVSDVRPAEAENLQFRASSQISETSICNPCTVQRKHFNRWYVRQIPKVIVAGTRVHQRYPSNFAKTVVSNQFAKWIKARR